MEYGQNFLESFIANWSVSPAVVVIILFFVFQLVYRAVRWIINVQRISDVVSKVPGPKGHWFWGHLFIHPGPGEEGIAWNMNLLQTLPKYHHFYDGWWKPCVSLKHPDCIKVLLKTAEPKDSSVGGLYFFLKPWLGNGLLVSSGSKWFRNRRLLTPGFHFDILKPYMNVYHDAANKLIDKFVTVGQNGAHSVEIFKPVSLCTLDVMLRCAFTYENNVQTSDNHQYVTAVKSIADLLLDRAYKPWMYVDRLYYRSPNGKRFQKLCDYVHGVADDLIYTRRAAITEEVSHEGKKYVDFLDILLLAKDHNGEGLTHEEIRDEVDTFLFEGHDTTASAISWILYSLATHPQIQSKCQKEVDSVILDPKAPRIQWDDLSQLQYLTQCVKESLRMYPPVPAVVRELASPLTIDGLTFFPGTSFEVNIFDLHHNHTVWGPDHDDYRPERFDPENVQEMDSYAFLPFSAGPRNCIGQHFAMHEIKVVVARILQRFNLHLDPSHKVERMPIVTMAAKDGIKLFFKPRHSV